MMRFWTKGILSLLLLAFSTVVAQEPYSIDRFQSIVKGEQQAAAWKQLSTTSTVTDNYDLHYHRFQWDIDPAVSHIAGSVTSYFEPLTAGFDSIYFDLSDSLMVDSVVAQGAATTFSQVPGGLLLIHFSGVIPMGNLDSVTVYYHGNPPTTGFGSFNIGLHDSVPAIWTLSEPYGASDWWPCKNGLTDKIDSIDMWVKAPVGNRVAGNGLLVSVTPVPGGNLHHWRHRHPIATYLIAFAATNYAEFFNEVPFGGDTLLVQNYVFPEDSANFVAPSHDIVSIIQLYDSLVGLYPFNDEKYGHAQFLWGGGMEHQTMSFMHDFGFELMAHECAHQWFGDKITCGSWEDIWLNEGWATYMSGLCYEHLAPQYWMPYKANRINFICSVPDGSVRCSDTTDLYRIFDGRLTYSKGAMILHSLRWVMGDSAFFAGVRNYLGDPTLAFHFALTGAFQQHLEAASGLNLTEYFNDWYVGEGYPSYSLSWTQTGQTVSVEVQQSSSHPSVSFFEMPIPIQFFGGAQDTIVVFDHTASGQVFTATLPYTVDSVHFDPEFWIIHDTAQVILANDPKQVQNPVEVFPNPTHGFVNLRGQQLERAELYDLQGQQLAGQTLSKSPFTQRMDLPALPAGLYVLQVWQKGAKQAFKLKVD
jgi:aminopeptidase N